MTQSQIKQIYQQYDAWQAHQEYLYNLGGKEIYKGKDSQEFIARLNIVQDFISFMSNK